MWSLVCAYTAQIIPGDVSIPSPADLVLSGRGCADLHGIVNFACTEFPEIRMQILHRSPRKRREVDFRSYASKRQLLDVVLRRDGLRIGLVSPAVLAHSTEQHGASWPADLALTGWSGCRISST